MKRTEVRFREAHESDYGLAYLVPYMDNGEGKKIPVYLAIEQVCREHEMYKGIAENMVTLQETLMKQLIEIKKEVHFTLLRAGDSEKSARTLLHLWNSYNFYNDVREYLPMSEMVTPPMEQATKEVGRYYRELAEKKRSRKESIESSETENQQIRAQTLPERKSVPVQPDDPETSTFDSSSW